LFFANLSPSLVEVHHHAVTDLGIQGLSLPAQPRDSPSSIAKPVRPIEFSFWVAVPFVNLFLVLAVVLGVIYGKAYANGTFASTSLLQPGQ
jgi:hypothetical protein